jgi:hypothetical protein
VILLLFTLFAAPAAVVVNLKGYSKKNERKIEPVAIIESKASGYSSSTSSSPAAPS